MNFDELNSIIESETDIPICPICGTPFNRYHRRQKTCGAEECKKAWDAIYQKQRRVRLQNEDREAFRKYHADAQRKSRRKKKRAKALEESYQILEDYWDKGIKEINKNIYGLDYGKRQAEKTLASVPKIDVNLKGVRNDRVEIKSDTE